VGVYPQSHPHHPPRFEAILFRNQPFNGGLCLATELQRELRLAVGECDERRSAGADGLKMPRAGRGSGGFYSRDIDGPRLWSI